jgi:cyclophilin family peptidyl-prolyl cis-trans isomerase
MMRAARLVALVVALLPAAAGPGVPDVFDVRLETSKGPIVIEVHREWAPIGAARFHDLVRSRYYDDTRIFRVVAGRWAQFGIHGDPRVSARWRHRTIPNDPPRVSNTRGTVAFAFAVPQGRTTQVFISLSDHTALTRSSRLRPRDPTEAVDAGEHVRRDGGRRHPRPPPGPAVRGRERLSRPRVPAARSHPARGDHSLRSAMSGSTCVARRAGR